MSLFTSKREKRLWFWILAVVLAIYLTAGLTRPLAGWMRETGLLGPAFMVAMLLVATGIIIQGFRVKAGKWEIGLGVGLGAVFLLLLVRMEIPEERTHLIEYGILGILIYEALWERWGPESRLQVALGGMSLTTILGFIDEGIQYFLPDRVFDLRDILFNFLAGMMAILASLLMGWIRQRRR